MWQAYSTEMEEGKGLCYRRICSDELISQVDDVYTLKTIPVAMKESAAIKVVALASVLPADEAVSPYTMVGYPVP